MEIGDGDAALTVSSTAIRRALERGDVVEAARGLGRRYSVAGSVIAGQQLGRTLGVPTANIELEPTNRLAHGVYAVIATVDKRRHPAVASFGVRPTVDNGRAAARSPSPGFRRRPLWPRDDSRVRRAHSRRAKVRIARRADRGDAARHFARARNSRPPLLIPIWRFWGNPLIPSPLLRPTGSWPAILMTDTPDKGFDYSQTLFLPKTDFPMRAGLPQKEPEILARWARDDLYAQLRASGKGRPKFVLHDGPPYANGNVHIGTALNKILKDMVVRSHQMAGKDSNYVPGWDCHGLPIEWKVEEEFYRKKGKTKPDFSDPAAIIAFRRECRAYAEHWVNVQREEFKRLGVDRRLGSSLPDDELSRGGADRPRDLQVRRQRPALSRLQAGHVERGREDGARRSRGRVRGSRQRHDLCRLPGRGRGRFGRHLDDDALDDSRQPRDRLFPPHRLRPLSRDRGAARQLGEAGLDLHSRRFACRGVFTAAKVVGYERVGDVGERDAVRDDLRPSSAPSRLRLRRAAARRRSRHRGRGNRLRPHRAGPRARGLRTVDGEHAGSSRSAASTRASPIRSTRTGC